jgi:type VI protein secretion system component VasA
MFDAFYIQNGLRQGNAVSPLLFNFGLEYTVRKAKENLKGLELNETHQFLICAAAVNLFRKRINPINTTQKFN